MSKRTLGVFKVRLDDLLYLDSEGEQSPLRAGEWVAFKSRIKMKDRRAIQNLDEDAPDDTELAKALNKCILAWSLSDMDAEPDAEGNYPPMPKPSVDAILDLSDIEVIHILEKFFEHLEPSKN